LGISGCLAGSFAYDNEGRPEGGMGLMGLAVLDHRKHGLSQCVGAANGFVPTLISLKRVENGRMRLVNLVSVHGCGPAHHGPASAS
jgi:hypothetical protein